MFIGSPSLDNRPPHRGIASRVNCEALCFDACLLSSPSPNPIEAGIKADESGTSAPTSELNRQKGWTSMAEENFSERRSRYVRMAAEATRLSVDKSDPDLRESCLNMAGSWLKLASAADSAAGREAPSVAQSRDSTSSRDARAATRGC